MSYFIDIHSHSSISNANICIYNLYDFVNISNFKPNLAFSAGIHPWFIDNNWEKKLTYLENLLSTNKLLAIGECGIDRKTDKDLTLQKLIFTKQALLSEKYKKTLIIHCVKAFNELFEVLKINKISQAIIFHGFINKPKLAEIIINEGYYISFGASLIKNNKNSIETIKNIPKNMIFLETDDTEINIIDIYKTASKILKIPIDELSEQIKLNFNKIFYEQNN